MLQPVDTSPRVCPFGECDGSTWIVDEETNAARPCRCREQQQRRAASGGIGSGIGRRFREVSFGREPIVSLDPVVLRRACTLLRSLAMYPVPLLLAEINRTFDRDSGDNYLAFFRRLCSVDLLVLDDLGAEKQTEWVLEQLYSIVNERWQDRSTIVVTTNLPDPDPQSASHLLARGARDLRDAVRGGRVDGRDLDELRMLIERLEHVVGEVSAREVAAELDPIARLRKQIG